MARWRLGGAGYERGRQLSRPYFGSTTFLITSLDRWITSSLSWAFSSRNTSTSARSSCGLIGSRAGRSWVPGCKFALPMSGPLQKIAYSPSISEAFCDAKMSWRGLRSESCHHIVTVQYPCVRHDLNHPPIEAVLVRYREPKRNTAKIKRDHSPYDPLEKGQHPPPTALLSITLILSH